MYVVFGIAAATLMFLFLLIAICSRCPLCLCSGTGCCGGRKPREAPSRYASCCARFCACGLGVTLRDGKMTYSGRSRCFARLYMLVFVLFVLVFIGIGQWKGNNQIVPAMRKV